MLPRCCRSERLCGIEDLKDPRRNWWVSLPEPLGNWRQKGLRRRDVCSLRSFSVQFCAAVPKDIMYMHQKHHVHTPKDLFRAQASRVTHISRCTPGVRVHSGIGGHPRIAQHLKVA